MWMPVKVYIFLEANKLSYFIESDFILFDTISDFSWFPPPVQNVTQKYRARLCSYLSLLFCNSVGPTDLYEWKLMKCWRWS